jgi:hypothetical protein
MGASASVAIWLHAHEISRGRFAQNIFGDFRDPSSGAAWLLGGNSTSLYRRRSVIAPERSFENAKAVAASAEAKDQKVQLGTGSEYLPIKPSRVATINAVASYKRSRTKRSHKA